MLKITLLHFIAALLLLDLSHAFTSRLLDHRENEEHRKRFQDEEHHASAKHHSSKSHSVRRQGYNGDEPATLSRRHVHSRQAQQPEQDMIEEIFGPDQQIAEQPQRHLSKRQSSASPTFYQSNAVPGSFINNHFHQYPQQAYQQMAYQQMGYQQMGSGYSPPNNQLSYLPFSFGLAPIILCFCCNQQQQPQGPSNIPNNNNNVNVGTRIDPDDEGIANGNGNGNQIDYDRDFFNTATGISLEPIPPSRNNSRPAPPISHGTSSNTIPLGTTRRPPVVTQRPVAQTTRRPMRPNQRPAPPVGSSNGNESGSRERNPRMCAYAVLQCCSNDRYDLRCFESRGCPGPFFDNPCDNELSRAVASYVNTFTFSP